MQRDMELIRRILFSIEDEYVDVNLDDLKIDGYDYKTVAYHCNLLYGAGMVTCYREDISLAGDLNFTVGCLTWSGHDFLDKVRNDTVWNKTKETIKDKGLPMILDVVKDIASTIVSGMVEGAIKGLKP